MNLSLALFIIWWGSTALLVGALSTWRLSAFLYTDKGIFGIMQKIRNHIAERDDWITEIFACFWCISLIVGFIISPLLLIAWPIFLPVALSGAAILLSHGGRIIWRYSEG